MPPERELWLQGLRRGFCMRCRLLGTSMVPQLRPGDLVRVAPGRRCRWGDIVLVDQGGNWVMHRVVAKSKGRIITKGDATVYLDPPVTPAEMLGKAVSRRRGGQESPLDSLWARGWGLAFCLALCWLFPLGGAVAGWGRKKLGRLSSAALSLKLTSSGPPKAEDGTIPS